MAGERDYLGRFPPAGGLDFRTPRVCDCGLHGFAAMTRGLVTFFDPDDIAKVEPFVWSWVRPNGAGPYAINQSGRIPGFGRTAYLHRVLGPDGADRVDHRDGNTLNNRKGNLRDCTARTNAQNARLRSDNRTGFKGVARHKRWSRLFTASIRVNGRTTKLGVFGSAPEAAQAYDEAARLHFGPYARTNADLGLLPLEAAE